MSDIRKLYLRALVEFVHDEQQLNSIHLSLLSQELMNMSPAQIVALHNDCMQRLTGNVEPEQVIAYYERAGLFLEGWISRGKAAALEQESPSRGLHGLYASTLAMKTKYENVLQHMDSGIMLFDASGFLTFINLKMSRLIGVPRTALIGLNLRGIALRRQVPRKAARTFVRLFREMIRFRIPYHELMDDNGRHLLITATYGDEMDGDLLVSVKDVTEYKRIELSAYQNDKLAMLGRISAAIAHEIRNPLTSIRGFIQLLRPELVKLGKGDYAQIILEEIDRANEIIYEFLNSSKPTAPIKREIRVVELIKEVALLFDSEARMEDCLIETGELDPALVVRVDTKQIKQVLLNIVKNALEAVAGRKEKQGIVRIWAEQQGAFVHLYISDNGNGIEPATLSRLFDPFFTTKKEGTGLGLSVSYRIIKNHGGTIHVDSRVGEGTSFRIALPLT